MEGIKQRGTATILILNIKHLLYCNMYLKLKMYKQNKTNIHSESVIEDTL